MSKGPPRQNKKKKNKEGSGKHPPAPAGNTGTIRLPVYRPRTCPPKMPIYPRGPEDREAPGKNGGAPKTRAAPGRTACPAIPNTSQHKE